MASNSTDDPGPATPRDELRLWLAVALAIVVVLSLALVGLQWFAVLGLVHVPAVLAGLLAARATVRLARGQPAALYVGRRAILPGAMALAVPALVLGLWITAREAGLFGARLARTESRLTSNTNWRSTRTPNGTLVEPAELVAATELTVVVEDGPLGDRIAEQLRAVAADLPHARVRGRLTVEVAAPWAPWPLWKSATCTGTVDAALVAERAGDVAVVVMLFGTVTFEGSWTMLGFASQRDFHTQIGNDLGHKFHEAVVKSVRNELEKK